MNLISLKVWKQVGDEFKHNHYPTYWTIFKAEFKKLYCLNSSLACFCTSYRIEVIPMPNQFLYNFFYSSYK